MTAYYNEVNPHAAKWLRNLIDAGQIAPGVVDERSIEDVEPRELAEFTQCHFFAGIGVWSLALRRAGWPDDVPVWTGSCPCQPFSKAGKGAGLDDDRHLWPAWFWLIKQRKPSVIFGEQVPTAIKHGWIDIVSSDLEAAEYAFGALRFGACAVGAPIERQRLYFAAEHIGQGMERPKPGLHSRQARPWGWRGEEDLQAIASAPFVEGSRWPKPLIRSVDDGSTGFMDPLHAYGNAINASAAEEFIRAYIETLTRE